LNGAIAGTYSGNLRSVLDRVLDGYDYVALVSTDGIELKVWASSGAIAHPTMLPPPPNLTATVSHAVSGVPPGIPISVRKQAPPPPLPGPPTAMR
jgi:hypothetical protein